MAKSILYTLSAGLLGFFIPGLFDWPIWARVLISLALMVAVGFLLVAGEALRVEIDEDDSMRIFVRNQLRHSCNLKGIELTMPTVRDQKMARPLPNMILRITDPCTKKTYKLDCAPFGQTQYKKLCERIRQSMDIVDQCELEA
ncbi:hypothetical protein LJC60_10550 [Ruminococcaceae bacterium OttesenSCG-928-D13]|nr:hypothetical protein [Ruminococcaceae bacterium OttesenSCG-928-D13]